MINLIIDANELLMRSIFVWRKNKNIPFQYFLLRQIIKYIKELKASRVFIAADGGHSWRKHIYSEYKANRKDFREKIEDVNWNSVFRSYNFLLKNLDKCTITNVIQIDNIEADDIISYLSRYLSYVHQEDVIIVSQDSDIRQLASIPRVKVYSTRRKKFVDEDNAINIIKNKMIKGDTSDNIPKANTFGERVRNYILVNLLKLPEPVEETIRNQIESVLYSKKEVNREEFTKVYKYKFLQKDPYLFQS